ncbi:MAG: ATPase, T2SS/T4P/T4SS family [Thermoprotei archaeon]
MNEGSTLRVYCPHDFHVFGLETNKKCREKVFSSMSSNTFLIVMENGIINKIYKKNVKELFNYIQLINAHFDKIRIQNISKDELIYDPALLRSSYSPNDLMKTWIYKHSPFFRELVDHFAMNYSDHEIYEWLFEPYVDYCNGFRSIIDSERINVYDVNVGFVNIYDHDNHCFYIIDEVSRKPNVQDLLEKMLWLIITKSTNLSKILVPLYDAHVQEMYLDGEDRFIYLDHEEYGRCSTNIFIAHTDIERIKTYASIIGKGNVSLSNPSLKMDIILNGIPHRFSLDSPPLVLTTSLNIRNLAMQYMNVQKLIKSGTITAEAIAYLIFLAMNRLNIVICGEPNSGKTTLANTIDLELPKVWRRIYIEDVVESLNLKDKDAHQIKIQTTPFEQGAKVFKKSTEIVKLLHRSPDWIYLGEIQTKEHTRAMFHAFSMGLKGIATTHAASIEGLFYRWTKHYMINSDSIRLINVVILMEREITNSGKIIRYVKNIVEIDNNGDPVIIFSRINGKLTRTISSLFDTPNVKKLITNGKSYEEIKTLFLNILNRINGGIVNEEIYQ